MHGDIYYCKHALYNRCTLYKIDNKGLSVIQQRFDKKTKYTWWSEIDPWLVDDIYLHKDFKEFFDKYASEAKDGLYPTVTIRQIMWYLRMKPLPKKRWETYFDKKNI